MSEVKAKLKSASLKFANTRRDFSSTVNKRVNDYFKSNNINRHANAEMVIKTVFMFSLYFVPYALIIGGVVTGGWSLLAMVVIMGFGLAGIGLSVMHDANHGAYSRKNWVNTALGYSINVVGANAHNWKIQHNILHHTYTNVHDVDEDINPRGVLRLTPHTPWKYMHQYQFIYAWFLYGLMTLSWMVVNDFVRMFRYQRTGLTEKHKGNVGREWLIMAITKVVYFTYIIVIPIVFTSLAWWQVLIGVFIMQYIAGFLLAIIFQPAHVIDGTEYPEPDENDNLENNWAIHQMLTTTNFGNNSRWFSWYVGGLNFQIEHHLFPHVCHVHYRKIAAIVKETAAEFGVPYKSAATFAGALAGHARLLRELGRKDSVSLN
ncbi:MAG TPA: acyl-CoA desaturase [Ohtaekwangia sp.]|nr:acyl-CoA desaturase [Ohtaekwangia sp.]